MNAHTLRIVCCLVLSTAFTDPTTAYEVGTHAWMTNEAYLRSKLAVTGPGSIRERLGFDRLPYGAVFDSLLVSDSQEGSCGNIASGSNPLHCYYDNLPAGDESYFYRRDPSSPFEDKLLLAIAKAGRLRDASGKVLGPASEPEERKAVQFDLGGWLMRGAVREDDIPPVGGHDADPRGNIYRVFNHFWDPVHNLDMSAVAGCPLLAPGQVCGTALKWATGLQDPLGPAQAEDTGRRQHFSYKDATNNYWWALTRQRSKEPGGSNDTKADDSRERMFRWATTFRSLGDVVHLLQDMAQPQHSRLDLHSPLNRPSQQVYENYTEARVLSFEEDDLPWYSPLRTIDNGIPSLEQVPAPAVGCYPSVAFSTVREFFSNQRVGDTVAMRMGLADYSNRGFFTQGTLPGNQGGAPIYDDPPRTFRDGSGNLINGYTRLKGSTHLKLIVGAPPSLAEVSSYFLMRAVPDTVPHGSCPDNLPASYAGKVPLATENLFHRFVSLSIGVPLEYEVGYTLSPENHMRMADVLVPRAIAYSASVFDFFFRGQLDVTAPTNRMFGVANQGVPHAMSNGYPIRTDTQGGVLGFEKIRLKVRNSTPPIQETSGGAAVIQSTGGVGAQLVAIARYHRNTCYKPDLSGERVQSYAPPPGLIIAEPVCGPGEVVRTGYQEISTSEPLSVASGELDVAPGLEVEKVFDFSADPIPVNATDLFIQVAYRGKLGDDADSIAVGTVDSREPTFASFWNNTDYWWNGDNWLPHTATYPPDAAKDFWVCAGSSPVKLVFHYIGATGSPALGNPVAGAGTTGIVRLGFLFPYPDAGIPAQRKAIRGVPVAYVIPGIPQIPVRSTFTSGSFRQANKERVDAATLTTPYNTCSAALPHPAIPEYWCFDTVAKERSQIMGAPAQPLYLEPIGTGTTPPDVDAPPAQPAFLGIALLATGAIRFNTDATLVNCPAQPASLEQPVDTEHETWIELEEEAASLGIIPNEG